MEKKDHSGKRKTRISLFRLIHPWHLPVILAILLLPLFLPTGLPSAPEPVPETHKPGIHPPGYFPGDPLPEKTAFLTFDDGPSDWTGRVLDILKARKIRGTFFICANWLPGSTIENNAFAIYRETLLRMIQEGHAIGNHTRSHRNFLKLTPGEIEQELDRNQELFDRALGRHAFPLTLIRPPFGEPWYSGTSTRAMRSASTIIEKRGLVILWSRHFFSGDSMDWVRGDWYREGPRVDIEQKEFRQRMLSIYNRLIRRVDGGGMVILFHDTHRTSTEILPAIIDELKIRGYRFGTMEDYVRWRWQKRSSEVIQDRNR